MLAVAGCLDQRVVAEGFCQAFFVSSKLYVTIGDNMSYYVFRWFEHTIYSAEDTACGVFVGKGQLGRAICG